MGRDGWGDAHLYVGCDMDAVELHAIGSGQAAVFSARSPDKETGNEDAAALFPCGEDACVLVVADGLGGERSGGRASALAVECMREAVEALAPDGGDLREAILNGIEHANAAIRDLSIGAGTTLAAVEVRDRTVRPYHVGDSEILAFGQRGRLKLRTVSHSPVGFAVEAGWLDQSEAMHHEQRHVVSNILGAPEMRIEVGPVLELAVYDTLVLASDGLCDNLETEEIADRVRVGGLMTAASRLADDARLRMDRPRAGEPSKPDDLTFVAYRPRRPARGVSRSVPGERSSLRPAPSRDR